MATNNESQEMKLINLNTKTLIQICHHLNYLDLYNLNRAHNQFNDAIRHVATNDDLVFRVSPAYNDKKHIDYENCVEQMVVIKEFVKLFGRDIQKLSIDLCTELSDSFISSCSTLMETIIECYCRNGTVKSCTFYGFELRKQFVEDNELFFRSLQSLQIMEPIKNDVFCFIVDFIMRSALKMLKICRGSFHVAPSYNLFQKIAVSQLEICVIEQEESNCDISVMPFTPNYTIQNLNLGHFSYDPIVLEKFFPNIEVLCYWPVEKHFTGPILNLNKLKQLTLHFYDYAVYNEALLFEIFGIENRLESLEVITYVENPADELIEDALGQMSNLKTLKLSRCPAILQQLPKHGHKLKNLKEFCYTEDEDYGSDEQEVNVLEAILDLVISCESLKTIKIKSKAVNLQKFYDNLVIARQLERSKEILTVHYFPRVCEYINSTPKKWMVVRMLNY